MAKSRSGSTAAIPEDDFSAYACPVVKPQTTYYYKVTSTEITGKSDGVESRVNQFNHARPASESWLTSTT